MNRFLIEFNYYFSYIYYLLIPAVIVLAAIAYRKYKDVKKGIQKQDKKTIDTIYEHIDNISEETNILKGNVRKKIEEIEALGFIQMIRILLKKEKRKPDPFFKQVYKALVK